MKAVYIIIGVVIVAVLVWGFLTGWGKKSVYSPAKSSPTPAEVGSPVSGQANISINNFAFNPATMTVTKGTKVTWKNDQNIEHNLVSDTGLFNQPMPPGSSFSFTFDNTGTFPYHCSIHPTMTGTITVQ